MATDVARLAMEFTTNGAQRALSSMEAIRAGSIKLTRATDEQIAAQTRLNSTYQAQTRSTGLFASRLRNLGKSFRVQKGAVQQAGFQFQDLAVQIGAGQSALVAFGQQGSQLAGILGPGGAVLGAVVAIGSALAGAYFAATQTASKGTETLRERIEGLRDSLEELTEEQIRGLRVEFFAENRQRQAAIQEERQNIRELTTELDNLRTAERAAEEQALMSGGTTPQLRELQEEVRRVSDELVIARGSLQTFFSEADQSSQELQDLIHGTDKAGDSAEDTAEKIDDMVKSAQRQANTIGLSARAIATYEAALAGANAEQILAIDKAFQRIEAHKQEQESIKQTAKAEQDRIKQRQQQEQALSSMRAEADPAFAEFGRYADQIDQIEQFNITAQEKERLREAAFRQHQDRMAEIAESGTSNVVDISAEANTQIIQQQRQLDMQVVSTFGNALGAMKGFAEQGSAEWAALVLAQRGIMASQAIMAANLAATLALANPLVGVAPEVVAARAETIRQLGYVNAGLILAQGVGEIAQSFDGGGYTGTGSRTGGIDGKGGFPAILHPNETVVDHTRGQSAGGSMIVNVNNAPQGTRVEQRTDNQGNQIAEVFIADVANGGPMSKTMQSTFGLRRQGR